MIDFLSDLLSPVTMVFAVSSMLSVGLGYTLREVLGPLRDIKGVVLVLLANFVLVPLWAILISRMLSLDTPYEVGLITWRRRRARRSSSSWSRSPRVTLRSRRR